MSMEERILAERCKAGDNDARRELYTRFGGRLLGICLRYVGDRATAEDLLHDCFCRIKAVLIPDVIYFNFIIDIRHP